MAKMSRHERALRDAIDAKRKAHREWTEETSRVRDELEMLEAIMKSADQTLITEEDGEE